MKWIAGITGGYSSSAKVVDGTLILTLPDALTPSVWRMDLGYVRSSALEVRQKDDGNWGLMLKTPKGDTSEVAPFANKAQAMRALMAVSRAMEHAHGHIRPSVAGAANDETVVIAGPAQQPRQKGGAMAGIVGIVILIGLVGALFTMGPRAGSMAGNIDASGVAPAAGNSADAAGVPVSADDFLRNR